MRKEGQALCETECGRLLGFAVTKIEHVVVEGEVPGRPSGGSPASRVALLDLPAQLQRITMSVQRGQAGSANWSASTAQSRHLARPVSPRCARSGTQARRRDVQLALAGSNAPAGLWVEERRELHCIQQDKLVWIVGSSSSCFAGGP